MLLTKHADVAAGVTKLKAFGYDKQLGERAIPGWYDVNQLGYNYRMNEIEAAIGVEQVKRIPGFLSARRANATALRGAFEEIEEISLLADGDETREHANYCLVGVLEGALKDKRVELQAALKEAGVGTSIYYPGPVPHLTYYKDKYNLGDKPYPNAARISLQGLALSVGPHLNEEDMLYIAQEMKTAIQKVTT